MTHIYYLKATHVNIRQEMDLNKLESEGIDTYITDGNMGGVKIHIAKEDLERAREILSDE